MSDWSKLADKSSIDKTITALNEKGVKVHYASNAQEAKQKALALIPKGAEVMVMSSTTCDQIGLTKEINESGDYSSVKSKLMAMDRKTQGKEMQKLGAAPEWAVGSIHALTHEGQAVIASQSGSQLPAYAFGSSNVIWVVGAQKIVKNLDEGFKRIYEYTLPLESERARKAYGVPGSAVNKLLIINNEIKQGRIHLILVNEVLGF